MAGWRVKGAALLVSVPILSYASYNRSAVAKCTADPMTNSASAYNRSNDVPTIVLYQHQMCFWCSYVRSLLGYLKMPYESIEVNPVTKSQIKFSQAYRAVPLAQIGDDLVMGSNNIASKLISISSQSQTGRVLDANFLTNDTEKWSEWCHKKMSVVLYHNVTSSFREAWDCLGYIDDVDEWNALTKLCTRTSAMFILTYHSGENKRKANELGDINGILKEWTRAIQGPFLHGADITMPDIIVYGILNGINRGQTFASIMKDNDRLRKWFENVKLSVE